MSFCIVEEPESISGSVPEENVDMASAFERNVVMPFGTVSGAFRV